MSTESETGCASDLVSREAVNQMLYEGYQRHLHDCTNSVRAAEFIHELQRSLIALPAPADTEQLVRLRAAAQMALKWLDWVATDPETSVVAPGFTSQETAATLRNALGAQEGKTER